MVRRRHGDGCWGAPKGGGVRALAEEEERAAFVRGALFGTVAASELRIRAEAHGLDPAGEYVAVRARLREDVSARKQNDVLGFQLPGNADVVWPPLPTATPDSGSSRPRETLTASLVSAPQGRWSNWQSRTAWQRAH